MDVFSECKRMLEINQYRVVPNTAELDELRFEDDTLLGMVWVVPSAEELIRNWKSKQDKFLTSNAAQLRRSEKKSWNIYLVLLAEGAAEGQQKSELIAIEEDFRSARKIAQADLKTRLDLQRALYPLLPIQNSLAPSEDKRALTSLDSRLKQAITVSGRMLLDVDFTEENLARFITAHEIETD